MSESEGAPLEIRLYREGIFYVAYERSAWLFYTLLHAYTVKKRYVKSVSDYVVSVGFPMAVLDKVAASRRVETFSGGARVSLDTNEVPDASLFKEWKQNFLCSDDSEPKKSLQGCNGASSVVERIKNFPVESSSPLECMMFLVELKKNLA